MTTSVALFGVSGRMGRALLEAMRDEPDLTVSGALASPASKHLGSDAGDLYGGRSLGVIVTSDREEAMAGAEVVIDFTLANSVPDTLRACVAHRCPLVLGTTGLSADALAQLRASATTIPILYAPNMSIGVNVMINLARTAARTLGMSFEADILDVHHRNKIDAPSGTALKLGESVASARGQELADPDVDVAHGGVLRRGADDPHRAALPAELDRRRSHRQGRHLADRRQARDRADRCAEPRLARQPRWQVRGSDS